MAKVLRKYREMSAAEVEKEEAALREEVWKLRLQMTTGQLQDPSKVKRARRNLARLLTIRREQELAVDKGDRR